MAEAPLTRYARAADGVHIAYQVFGEGPIDVAFVWGVFSHVELSWEHEAPAHYLRRLASFSRVIHFDKRGTGLSDRPGLLATLEEQMDDVVAVMDAVGTGRVVMLAGGDSGLLGILFAAAHPERTAALVLSGSRPRITSAPGFPWGPPPDEWHALVASLTEEWGSGQTQVVAPSQDDPASLAWWARLERYSLSPGSVAQLWEVIEQTDVRSVLPTVHVPTLVMHRHDDPFADVAAGRYVAGHIPGARFVEIAGNDHPGWASGADTELDEIEDFLTGTHGDTHSDRVLATVLFTDIVDSTRHAIAVGDRRWRQLLADHEAISRGELDRHRGQWVKFDRRRDPRHLRRPSPGHPVRPGHRGPHASTGLAHPVRYPRRRMRADGRRRRRSSRPHRGPGRLAGRGGSGPRLAHGRGPGRRIRAQLRRPG